MLTVAGLANSGWGFSLPGVFLFYLHQLKRASNCRKVSGVLCIFFSFFHIILWVFSQIYVLYLKLTSNLSFRPCDFQRELPETTRERERESPRANDMSLWGAVPLHPRVRRTQGSEVAAGRAGRAGTCQGGGLAAWWPGSSREGKPAGDQRAQRRLGLRGEPRRLQPCLTAPTAATPASAALPLLANR